MAQTEDTNAKKIPDAVRPTQEPITPNIPPPTMTSTKRVVRIRRDTPKIPKLDETVEDATENATETDSDTSFHTRDAEITDETLTSSSNNSPDTTVPEQETAMAEEKDDTMQTEETTGGNINPIRRSGRTSKKTNKMGGSIGKTLNGDNLFVTLTGLEQEEAETTMSLLERITHMEERARKSEILMLPTMFTRAKEACSKPKET